MCKSPPPKPPALGVCPAGEYAEAPGPASLAVKAGRLGRSSQALNRYSWQRLTAGRAMIIPCESGRHGMGRFSRGVGT